MVKVLKCHNFRAQAIVPAETEPQVLSSGRDKLFIGTGDSTIDVFTAVKQGGERQWTKFCSFQTGAPATQLIYNQTGDYVATLECKKSRRSEVVSVKTYLNWGIAHSNPGHRTRVRVASLGYRSTKVETDSRLEVIDIQCPKPATAITTCQQTGNLGIAFKNTVQLFHLVEKTIPNSQTTYLDVVIFLELTFDYQLSKIDLCEEYLVSGSQDFVQVFCIVYSDDAPKRQVTGNRNALSETTPTHTPTPRETPSGYSRRVSSAVLSSLTQQDIKLSTRSESGTPQKDMFRFSSIGDRSSTTPSPSLSLHSKASSTYSIEDDPDFVQWTFTDEETPRTNTSPGRAGAGKSSLSNTVSLHNLEKLLLTPELDGQLPQLKDLRGGSHLTTGQISLTALLTRKLDPSDHAWLHLQLIPTYMYRSDAETKKASSENAVPVHSTRHFSLSGMSCLLTGSRSGFMYSLLQGTKCLSTYRFTEDARQVLSDGNLVYVVKDNGLETYTARCHVASIHDTSTFDHVTQTCPSTTAEVCLVGVQQFLGTREITVTEQQVILLIKVPDNPSENIWNIYALQKPTAADLYRDMVAFADRVHSMSSETYHHLLLEGHMILRSSLIGQSSETSNSSAVQDLLLESCALLGEFYAMPGNSSWYWCRPYYVMSGLSPADIVRQALQYKQHSKITTPYCYGQGLVHYLSYVLFLEEDPLTLKESDCDLILAVCSEAMPDSLADIVLFSRLRNYTPEKALLLIQHCSKQRSSSASKSRGKDSMAIAALNLQLCDPELAQASLIAMDKRELIDICLTHHQVLHTDFQELSPLSQLIRCHCPEMLVYVLVLLYDRGTMPLDLAIKLLQGKSGVPELHKNTHVMDYLEHLINDASRRFIFEEAVSILCEIYVKRMLEWEPPTCRELTTSMKFRLPTGSGHFGRRHKWLDFMPPFTGPQSISKPCQHVIPTAGRRAGLQSQALLQCQKSDNLCCCFLCNEELLKLQSVLCSSHCTPQLCDTVLALLTGVPSLPCYDSIFVLCKVHSNMTEAVQVVVNKFPQIAAMFGAATLRSSYSQWEMLLTCLLDRLRNKNFETEDGETLYVTTLKEILSEMAEQFSPKDFLKILPDKGNFFFFMPYIQLCMDKHRTALLREKILVRGGNLAQSL